MADPTVVLDCRWLGNAGPGRATELVLRGLAESPPSGRWVLWGPEAPTRALAWPRAEVSPSAGDPRLWLGQRHTFGVPPGDFYIFMHQQRPLRNLRSATMIYDTIPLHHDQRPAARRLKRLFLRRVARTSSQILTISEHSRACIVRELRVAPDRVEIVRFPFDSAFVDRVAQLRARSTPVAAGLFIGAFLPHKNLPRLLAAFGNTDFCRQGGRLILAGGRDGQSAELESSLDEHQRGFVDVRSRCTQAEIERLYATARFLVQPSLEEGFGLPAWEAMCCGLPVCVSDGGALPEVTRGFADAFPAESVPAMAAAIDACAEEAGRRDARDAVAQSARLRDQAPTIAEFGRQVAAVVARHIPVPR